MLTAETLARFAPRCALPGMHADALERTRAGSSVTTPAHLAAFLGQVYVETAGFTRLVENMRYRTPEHLDAVFGSVKGYQDAAALIRKGDRAIANRVYANRLGNGNEASGDGWAFRGSGYLQVTGAPTTGAWASLPASMWRPTPTWPAIRSLQHAWPLPIGIPRGCRSWRTVGRYSKSPG